MIYSCPICGLPAVHYYSPDEYKDVLNKMKVNEKTINRIFKKLQRCIILTFDNKILRNSYQDGGYLINGTDFYDYWGMNINNYQMKRGAMIHTDCWKYIKNKYNIELCHGDLPYINTIDLSPKMHDLMTTHADGLAVNFGEIQKYQLQYFDLIGCIRDGNHWMIDIPQNTKNPRNITRINKIVKQYKLNRSNSRPSPNISATFFVDGVIKIGNDMKFHIIRKGRWYPTNEKVITKHYEVSHDRKQYRANSDIIRRNKFLNKLKQIGSYSYQPIFISRIEFGKKYSFDIHTTQHLFDSLVSKYLD